MSTLVDALPGVFGRRTSDSETETTSEESGDSPSTMSRTGGNIDQDPVVVWEAVNQMEAQIVKGRLISEDIPAIIRGEALGTIYGLTSGSLAATDVLVPAPLAEKALDILNTEVVWEESEEDDGIAND